MWTPRSVTQLARSELAWRALTDSHVGLYRLTGGRIGGRVRGVDILLLDHLGRRTGKRRTAPLLYVRDGKNLVIIASKGGAARDPAWWVNLRASTETEVQVGPERFRVKAREAEGTERERLWEQVVAAWPDYEAYQRRTERRIPVIVLEPAA